MNKKHIAIGVGVITFLATAITIILVWMMNYQSDVIISSSQNSAFQWQQLHHSRQANPNTTENFTLETPENTASETITQPQSIMTITPAEEATEPALATPVVPEQPKIPWSQFNQSLLELEQEQTAVMTLLSQKYAATVEVKTEVVKPETKTIAPDHQTVETKTTKTVATPAKPVEPPTNPLTTESIEIKPEATKQVAAETQMVITPVRPVEPQAPPLATKTIETKPETPKTVITKTEIIAMPTKPLELKTNTLLTATKPIELTDLLGEKPALQPRELTWDADWLVPVNSNTWLNIGQQIFELEQWREKTINSLNIKFDHHNKANEQ